MVDRISAILIQLKMQCHDFFSPLKHDDQVLRLYKVKDFFEKSVQK